jgi:hypothetical protein
VEPDEDASVFATGLVEVATDSETVCGDGRHPTLAALELRHQRGHAARDPRALGSGSAEIRSRTTRSTLHVVEQPTELS